MAGNQDDIGAMSAAGMFEMSYYDTVIKDMAFDFSSDTGREYYPYPTSMSLGEPDAVSNADKECAHFLDTSRLPSSFIYEVESSKQEKPPVLHENLGGKEAHDQLPKERSKCDNCSASFARRADLRRHAIAQHSPHFIYKCTTRGCTKKFHRKDKFQEHVRRIHECEARPSVEDVVQKTIYRYLHDTKSKDLAPEGRASNNPSTGQSFWTSLDMQMRQFLGKDTTASTTDTQYSYEPSEEFNTTLNDSSRKGNILTPSTSSSRTVSCKDPKEVYSVDLVGEIGPAKVGLACPYRKHNPVNYNIHSHTTCAKSSWDSVTRVKEHLIRHHRARFKCTRCCTCFPTEVDVSIHLKSTNLCELRHISPAEGMTPDVERRIRSRKRRDQSESRKWKEMYTILFPEEKEIPAPYFVPIGDDAAAAKDKFAPLVPLFFSYFDSQTQPPPIPPPPPASESTTKWIPSPNASLREEFPRLFRSRLEGALARHGAPVLDATLKSQIFDIVAECWDEVLLAQNRNHSTQDLECDDEEISAPPTGYTLLPAAESIVNNSQPNSDVVMASLLHGL